MTTDTTGSGPTLPDDEVLETVRAFVLDRTGGEPVGDDVDIFDAGHVSSLFAVQIVMWVERTFDLLVSGDDLDIRNFTSIGRIARFVTSRLPIRTR